MAVSFSSLQVGDRIVTIGGTSTEGMTHTQAVNLLKSTPGSIEMQVRFFSQALFRIQVARRHRSFDVKPVKTLKSPAMISFNISLEHK